MATYSIEAVVLRTRHLGEADVLATLYSRDRGKLRGVARSARKPRSRLAGGVQAFTHGRFEMWEGRSLDGIRQVQITSSFPSLRSDLDRMMRAGYVCRVADLLTTDEDPSEPFFLLLVTTLTLLESLPPDLVRRFFEIRALGVFGFRPGLDSCSTCGGDLGGNVPVAFSGAAGGACCRDCRDPGAAGIILSPGARTLLARLQRVHPRDLSGVSWAEFSGEAGRALDLLLEHVIEGPLGGDLLDTVDRGPDGDG